MSELAYLLFGDYPEFFGVTAVFLVAVFFRYEIAQYFTFQPLPGIPHLDDQVPFLGDALALGQWRERHHTLTAWFDHVAMELVGPGSKHQGEGICQVVFGLGGGARQVIVTDAREAEDILVRRTAEFDRAQVSVNVFSGILPFGQIALPTNAMWKHHRRIVGPSMTSKNLAKFAPRAWTFANELVELWKAKADLAERVAKDHEGKGKKVLPVFQAKVDMSLAFSDAISDIAFGEPYGCTRGAVDQVKAMKVDAIGVDALGGVVIETKGPPVYVASQGLFTSLPFTSPFPKLSNFYSKYFSISFRRNRGIVDKYLDRRIAAGRALAIERGNDRTELADTALDLCCLKEGGPDSLSDEAMRSELFQFLVAGEETSATTMSWFVKYMARNPEAQRKLRKEILEAGFDQTAPTLATLQADKTPYLEAVVHESLRLACSAGAVNRIALKDTVVLGRVIPKGANILIPLSNLQTRPLNDFALKPSYESKRSETSQEHASEKKAGASGNEKAQPKPLAEWKNPAEFSPDRWLDKDGTFDREAGTSWPFSLGQRGCFGKALAVLELKLFVAALNLAFFFEPIPGELDTDEANEFITRKPRESYVRLSKW